MPQGIGTYGSTRGRPPVRVGFVSGGRAKRRKDKKEKIRLKKRRIDLRKKARAATRKEAKALSVDETKKAFREAGGGHKGRSAQSKVIDKKADELYQSRVTAAKPKEETKTETTPKKFDYRNKMGTKMPYWKAVKRSKGKTASEIANDPDFFKNTSEGKYWRGVHKALEKGGKSKEEVFKKTDRKFHGGYVGGFKGAKGTSADAIRNKPSTKISFGNKWN